MEYEENQQAIADCEMDKRCETMPDGRRYIVYYTFAKDESELLEEIAENV